VSFRPSEGARFAIAHFSGWGQLLGGAAEVSRYGMYDTTEDFFGGGANPPMIHDPGEFADLKANG